MAVVVGLALGLILAGLLMTFLAGSLKQMLLQLVVYWTGVVLVIVGLVLLLSPVVAWLNVQLRAMLGM